MTQSGRSTGIGVTVEKRLAALATNVAISIHSMGSNMPRKSA
jgi:hypothetical protein